MVSFVVPQVQLGAYQDDRVCSDSDVYPGNHWASGQGQEVMQGVGRDEGHQVGRGEEGGMRVCGKERARSESKVNYPKCL